VLAQAAETGTWRRVDVPGAGGPSRINAVTWAVDRFVAVGSSGEDAAVWRSTDGADWRRADDITDEAAPAVMHDVAAASPGFLAVGSVGDDAAMWSAFPEADSWRRVLVASFLGARMNAVENTWAGEIAVGFDTDTQSAGIWRFDGNVWTQIPTSPDFEGINLLGVETGSFELIAIGEDLRDGSGAALVSPDGVTWTRLVEMEIAGARLWDAHWGPFTVVGGRVDPGLPELPQEAIFYDVSGGGSDEWRSASVTDLRNAELTAITFSGHGDIAVGFAPGHSEAVVFETKDFQTWVRTPDPGSVFANAGMTDVERGGAASDVLVASGWSGTGFGDGPDARATIWTTAAGGRRAFVDSVPSPLDITLDPVVVATSVAAAAGVAILVPFPGALFNSTLEANYEEVSRWWGGIRRRVGALAGRVRARGRGAGSERGPGSAAAGDFWRTPLGVAAFLVISSVLYALLDPTLGFDLGSAALVIGLLLGLLATTLAFAVPTLVFHRIRAGEFGRLRVLPATILIAVACVVLTRATGFQPGYLYGLLIGFTFARDLSVGDEGRSTAIASLWMLVVTVAAWIGLIPAGEAAAANADDLGAAVGQAALTTVVVAGLEALVFGLLPLRFLPGAALYSWSRRAWTVLFGLGMLGFLHVLINPQSGYLADSARTPLLTIVALFVAFGLVSVLFWAFFRFRRPRAERAATA
jgi:hypothetical protein